MKKLTKEQQLTLYRNLVRTRKFDELNVQLMNDGKLLTFYHSCQGHEAVGVGACTFLNKDDYVWGHHRGHGLSYAISKGLDPKLCIAEHMGKATGWGFGITGFHAASPEHHMLSSAGTIGSGFPISAGWALAAKKRGQGQVSVCFAGDGGMQRGQAHESMNLAAAWKLPVVWVVENNGIAWFTPCEDTCPLVDIADMAAAYKMPGVVVDGADVLAVYEAIEVAVERARAGKGPSLVECKVARFRPHSEGRPNLRHVTPIPEEELEQMRAERDPVKNFREHLLEKKVLTEKLAQEIDQEYDAEVEAAVKFSADSPYPDPEVLTKLVYAD
ncbi:MAG: thiamine pyrophosphate-dependent dehydrogenase E1 component subunit alpha [Deltaproteobacteria bacterium]|nr:thiamine pyrophosphate-dependent dehydrogenase E1 component subunit alpha [Deltaproteobacteria bacterium]